MEKKRIRKKYNAIAKNFNPNNVQEDVLLMDELINLRPDGASLRGIGLPDLNVENEYTLQGITLAPDKMIRVPVNTNILVFLDGSSLKYVNSSTAAAPQFITSLLTGETLDHFTALNGTVVAYTNRRPIFLQYNKGVMIMLPDLEMLNIQVGESHEPKELKPNPVTVLGEIVYFDWLIERSPLFEQMMTEAIEKYDELRNQGYFFGNVSFTFAYKLFDGSYSKHTVPHIWSMTGDEPLIKKTHIPYTDGNNQQRWNTNFAFQKMVNYPLIHYSVSDSLQDQTLIQYWNAGIVKSLCVFMTPETTGYDIFEGDITKWKISGQYEEKLIPPYSDAHLEKFMDSINYYKVAEVDIEQIITNLWPEPNIKNAVIPVKVVNSGLQNIETYPVMPADNFTHHTMIPQATYVYNNRLHIGNIAVKPGDPENLFIKMRPTMLGYTYPMPPDTYNSFDYKNFYFAGLNFAETLDQTLSSDYSIHIYTELRVNDDIYAVMKQIPLTEIDYFTGEINKVMREVIILKPYISYWDARAIRTAVLMKHNPTGVYKLMEVHNGKNTTSEWSLTSSAWHNVAYNINKPASGDLFLPHYLLIPQDFDALTTFTPNTARMIWWQDKNRLQVSEFDNAFLYPAKNSYRIGNANNTVKAMIAQILPLTEMQFGQFPLLVFSSSGVYTMSQGSTGEVLYAAVHPFSTDTIFGNTKPFGVGNNMVCYLSSDGLVVTTGRERQVISGSLIGEDYFKADLPASVPASMAEYKFPARIMNPHQVLLDNNKLYAVYDYFHNEIIVQSSTTAKKRVQVVFNMNTSMWYKRFYFDTDKMFFDQVQDGYAIQSYLQEGDSIVKYIKYTRSSLDTSYLNPFYLQTRPIANVHLSRIQRIVQRCTDLVANASIPVTMLVYGTNELTETQNDKVWRLISHTVDNSATVQSIMAHMQSGSYRYYVIVLSGLASRSTQVQYMEMDTVEKYGRKLR